MKQTQVYWEMCIHQVVSEGFKSFPGLLHLVGRALQDDLVQVRVELHMHFGQVLSDLLYILTLASNDEAMEPAGSIHILRHHTVGSFIHL